MNTKLTPDQAYIELVLEKFNMDQDDSSLDETEKVLLRKIKSVQQEIVDLSQQVDSLNEEIKERQNKGTSIIQQIVHKQGQSQAYIDSLLSLHK